MNAYIVRASAATAVALPALLLLGVLGCNALREPDPFSASTDDVIDVDAADGLDTAPDAGDLADADDADTTPPPAGCGDGVCAANESASTCCADCACPLASLECPLDAQPSGCHCVVGEGFQPQVCDLANGETCCKDRGCVSLLTSNANCGSCGTVCQGESVCDNGECLCNGSRCAEGELCCDGACRDAEDPACQCGGGDACSGGQLCCDDTCIDVDTPDDCGACGRRCDASQGCNGSDCACLPGRLDCDGDPGNGCEVDRTTSALHCGACGNACGTNQACVDGQCVCPAANRACDPDEFCCAGTGCVDRSSDAFNCGSCGNTCPAGQPCTGGTCSCTGGGIYCSSVSTCVDNQSNADHCGTCDHACADGAVNTADTSCSSGVCRYTCTNGMSDCTASPGCETNTNTSALHCGACGNACGSGQVCCGGSCKALANDPSNCGTCGNACGNAATCNGGSCQCNAGRANCDGNFASNGCEVNTTNDDAHCGNCTTSCGPNSSCSSSLCTCDPGRADCDGSLATGCEAVLADDDANCGACGNSCTGFDTCVDSQCELGDWYFVTTGWVSDTLLRTLRGTATFAPDDSYSLTSITSNGGTPVTGTGALAFDAQNRVSSADTGGNFTGQITRRGDVLVLTDERPLSSGGAELQSVWVRKTTGHTLADLTGSWHVLSFLDETQPPGAPSSPYSLFGSLTVTGTGSAMATITNTASGTNDTWTGSASTTSDGRVTINITSSHTWEGQLNAFNDFMVLTADPNTSSAGFQRGHLLLVKKGSGHNANEVLGEWYFSHLVGTFSVYGHDVDMTSSGFAAGGTLGTSGGATFAVCSGGSLMVTAAGAITSDLPHGSTCTMDGMTTGWMQPAYAARTDLLIVRANDSTTASVQLWIREP